MERDIEELFGRGVGSFVDPQGEFKRKLIEKAKGEYKKDLVIKFGVDPTRPDIHLGHAVVLRRLRQFQDLGVKVVFLVGDFTASIGDPTGKSKVRPEISQQEVEVNMKTFLDQVGKILRTDEAVFSWIRNSEWFLNVTDVASDAPLEIKIDDKKVDQTSFVGKALLYENTRMQKTHLHKNDIRTFSLVQMLSVLRRITHSRLIARDMFQDRLEKGEELFMHEMMYPVLQGIDSLLIAQIYGSCDLEIGGTDQTFNMLVGRDVMKMSGFPEQSVLAMEIITGTDGVEKMSKSLNNYIAITDSPGNMFGKVMSIPDHLMPSYFALASYAPLEEIEEIQDQLEKGALHPKEVKMRLAEEITAIYHGVEAAKKAREEFVETFSNKGVPEEMPITQEKRGSKIIDILVSSGIVESKSEARRLVESGAVTNAESGESVGSVDATLEDQVILKIGKRRFLKIEVL